MKKLLTLLINLLLIASCTPNIESKDINDENRIQHNSELNYDNVQFDYRKQVASDIIEESIQSQPEEDKLVIIELLTDDENKKTLPQVTDEQNSQPINENEQPASPIDNQTIESPVTEVPPKAICPNAWYDENQPCDWIPDNLKPLDELGRSVPSFPTSQEAWNWGEAQMYDNSSNWYLCGFTRMEGNKNDGTIFYYAYMKSCPNE